MNSQNWSYNEIDGDSPRPSVRVGGARPPAPIGDGSWLETLNTEDSPKGPSVKVGSLSPSPGVDNLLGTLITEDTAWTVPPPHQVACDSVPDAFLNGWNSVLLPPPITEPLENHTPPAPTSINPPMLTTPDRPTFNMVPPPFRPTPALRKSNSRRMNYTGCKEIDDTNRILKGTRSGPPNLVFHTLMRSSVDGTQYLSMPDVFSHVSMGGRLSINDRIFLGEYVKEFLQTYYRETLDEVNRRPKILINSAWNPVVGSTEQIRICHYLWEDYPLIGSACLMWFHKNKESIVY